MVLVPLAFLACSGYPMGAKGIACDPMAYQSDRNEVWVMTEGRLERVSEDGLTSANPAVSPDGTRILFSSGRDADDLDLYMIDLDGTHRRLVWGDARLQSEADWSPDGGTLVFDQVTEEEGLQIFTIPADGTGEPLQLTHGEPNGKPMWGIDGRVLLLSLRDGRAQEIYSMNPDGSDAVNLTNNPARDVLARLSPDGTSIVFASDRSGNGDLDIWLMDADGSDPRRLTDGGERETNPTWSSDGRHIVFRTERNPAGLWAMNPDGTGQRPLLEHGWLASCP